MKGANHRIQIIFTCRVCHTEWVCQKLTEEQINNNEGLTAIRISFFDQCPVCHAADRLIEQFRSFQDRRATDH